MSHEHFVPIPDHNQLDMLNKDRASATHVNIVTALLGTVRSRLTDSPLYNDVHPSFAINFLVVYTIPPRGCCLIMPSEDKSSAINRRCVCIRVRTTS